jgi:hypothetical protein
MNHYVVDLNQEDCDHMFGGSEAKRVGIDNQHIFWVLDDQSNYWPNRWIAASTFKHTLTVHIRVEPVPSTLYVVHKVPTVAVYGFSEPLYTTDSLPEALLVATALFLLTISPKTFAGK